MYVSVCESSSHGSYSQQSPFKAQESCRSSSKEEEKGV